MQQPDRNSIERRTLLKTAVASLAICTAGRAAEAQTGFQAGEGRVDITPPLGIEMGGFHRAPGKERRIKGVRGPCQARALVLKAGATQVAICSLDVACVGEAVAGRIRRRVAERTGIPADHVRIACTHTHSMPSFCYLRQWGSIPQEFMATVEQRAVQAVEQARADLAPAEALLGKSRCIGGNHNRTTREFRTDEAFAKESSEKDRWLDSTIQALLLPRSGGKRTLVWYHFSAHAVCYADEVAGPDWPGEVAQLVRDGEKLEASFLQGHCGDVNPGNGKDWRGEIRQTVGAIYPSLKQAIAAASPVKVDALRSLREEVRIPYDMELFKSWLAQYRNDPSKRNGPAWVDAGFAEDWFRGNVNRDLAQQNLPATISALRLGEVAMLFHPAELYSYYGLAIRRDSPLPHTMAVGYTDGMVGYLCDPQAYRAGEYAAMTVPKILDYPPFTPDAAAAMTAASVRLLKQLA